MHRYERLTGINDQLNDRYVAENEFRDVVTYPKLVTLTTTLRCNYRCWMCYQKEFKGDMDWRIVERLEHVLPFVKTLQIFGGEPLVYSRLDDLCKLAGDSFCELELITNGSLLDEKRRELLLDNNARLIKISMEAATQETYKSIRGGDLKQVLTNVSNLAKERDARGLKHPDIQTNFVAMRRNIEELPDFIRLAAEAGIDRVLVLFMNAQSREDLAQESLYLFQELSDTYMDKALAAGLKHGIDVSVPGFFDENRNSVQTEEPDRTCHSPWKNCLIDMQGNVRICCGKTPGLGNLLETPFDELWFGETVTPYRKLVNTADQPTECRTCRVKARNIKDVSFHIRDKELAKKLLAKKL